MGEFTQISWTDSSFNPWMGCTKVSPGCDHCYAEAEADHRYGLVEWGPHGERKRTKTTWRNPVRWNADADRFECEHGHRHRVFCASWADVFDNQADPQWRVDLFDLIKQTPRLDWQLLTKRPQNINKMLPSDWGDGWSHVWLGTTCEDQEHYDQRWPILSSVPAVIHFISYEPALGPLKLTTGPDWLICGGESGRNARMMEPAWARSVRDQCAELGISFFMKQMTALKPIPDDLLIREVPKPGK